MKISCRAIFGSCLLLFLALRQIRGEETPSHRVRISVEVVAIDPAPGIDLIPRLRAAATREAAYEEIQQLVDRDAAELLAWPIVTMSDGSDGGARSSYSVRFPTEFEPPQIPQTFGNTNWPIPPFGFTVPEPGWGAGASAPTAFETRDCGAKLRATARVIGNGKSVETDLDASFTRLLGFHEIRNCKDAVGIEGIFPQPEFQNVTLNPTIRFHDGEHLLAGCSFVQKPAPKIILFLGSARAIDVGPDLTQPDDGISKTQAASCRVFAECRMVTLPQKLAIRVINQADTDEAGAWNQVDELLKSGEAHLTADLVTLQRNGEQATATNMAASRTPTEFEPNQFPRRLPKEQIQPAFGSWPVLGMTPTAFSILDTGEAISLEAIVSRNGQSADLKLDVQDSHFLESWNCDYAELPDGKRLALKLPSLQTLQNQISARVRNGEKILLGVHKLSNPEKTFELFFLRLTISAAQ